VRPQSPLRPGVRADGGSQAGRQGGEPAGQDLADFVAALVLKPVPDDYVVMTDPEGNEFYVCATADF
jgi:hypothetical protein